MTEYHAGIWQQHREGPFPRIETRVIAPTDGRGPVRRILLVDDEQALLSVMRRYLDRQGWNVSEARSAEEALELLHDMATGLDAVVVDLHLPDLSGSALCRRILADHPILVGRLMLTTGDVHTAEDEMAEQCLDCPVMSKPFDLPDLDRALMAMVGRDRAGIAHA